MNIDEENTFRALKDQAPIATSRWCFFGIHTWERWGKAYKPKQNSSKHIQTRHCVHCNKLDVQEVQLPHWLL
jgi:hypothetical protein